MFDREELQHIREKALELARGHRTEGGDNDVLFNWRHAFYKLANAADYLDAMIARTEVK